MEYVWANDDEDLAPLSLSLSLSESLGFSSLKLFFRVCFSFTVFMLASFSCPVFKKQTAEWDIHNRHCWMVVTCLHLKNDGLRVKLLMWYVCFQCLFFLNNTNESICLLDVKIINLYIQSDSYWTYISMQQWIHFLVHVYASIGSRLLYVWSVHAPQFERHKLSSINISEEAR